MKQTFTNKQKITQLFTILLPILVTQVGMFSLSFFDTTMAGKYSPVDLAGVAIGASLWAPIYSALSGFLLAIPPIVAQLMGQKQEKKVSFSVIQGMYLSIAMSISLLIVAYFLLNPILNLMGLEQDVQIIAHDYLVALGFGVLPIFLYTCIRSFIDALGHTRVTMFITLTALPINIGLNYLFINGVWIFPELGGVGTGYATSITYWIILLIALHLLYHNQPFARFRILSLWPKISWKKWKEILTIGIPIGFSIFFETSIFSAVTILMSEYNTITIASHQAALNFASLLYMVPLSISTALTILVGFEVGAKRFPDAKSYSWIGVTVAVSFALVGGIILLILREDIASLYTSNKEVLMLASHFLIYAIFFQLSDAIQAPIQGALRGYKDVNLTFLMSLISYWVIGLPSGYLLANYTNWGAFGYWIGLIIGLAVGAICLASRLVSIQKNINLKQIKNQAPLS